MVPAAPRPAQPTGPGVTVADVGPAPRSAWVDNLRTAAVVLVVHLHSSVTYSHVGDWYLNDGPEGSLGEKLPYIFWNFHLQSFFMGLLFFLSGAFAHGAIGRHGTGGFIRERLVRLGAPAVLYMAVLHPFIVLGLLRDQPPADGWSLLSDYVQYVASGRILSGSGPMWFALALLGFCAVLAVWRMVAADVGTARARNAPGVPALLLFAGALTLGTAAARVFFPIGTSVMNFQLCYFPQYVAAFAAGVAAGRGGWLDTLAESPRARLAGRFALVGGPLALGALLFLGGGPTEGPNPGDHGPILYFGGWNLHALGAAAWEQFTGVGLALGMMALFRRCFDRAGRFARWMSARSFGVYVLHAPIMVLLTLAFRPIEADKPVLILLLTAATLVVSFAAADVARRTPLLKTLF